MLYIALSFDLQATELNAQEIQRVQDILGTPALSAITPRFVNIRPIQLPTAQDVLTLTPKLDELHRFSKEHGTAGIVVFGAQESGKACLNAACRRR